ncbi:MAG: hypothetical protein JJE41_14695 [Candidatus Heimdallarchaeota archaeon]|nr:hypothetical protein [Candidatus Heimdallarchaeota archaeon]
MATTVKPRVEKSFLRACPLFQRIIIAAAEKEYQKELSQKIQDFSI